ncbi:hypothetical protein FHG87_008937 [Trinorchestia longiramus]|nr:hypothetical protein FHG87_008937 [Trinorchestia longiramus]
MRRGRALAPSETSQPPQDTQSVATPSEHRQQDLKMKVALIAVLLLAVYSASAEPSPEHSCQGVEQVKDTSCEGFFICQRAKDNPICEVKADSGNPDYVLCHYPCRNGKKYDYENRKCSYDFECPN